LYAPKWSILRNGTAIALPKLSLGGSTVKHRLLLIEDEELQRELTQNFLLSKGFDVEVADSGESAMTIFGKASKTFSVVIVDLGLPGIAGLELTDWLIKINPDQLVLVFSGNSHQKAALDALRSGAKSFVNKSEGISFFLEQIKILCREFEFNNETLNERQLPEENSKEIIKINMIGQSSHLARVAGDVIRTREKNRSVLILGESGTGKELVARALHHNRTGRFYPLNCAKFAMNEQMAGSELFGHKKGAFTGATSDQLSAFSVASGGTLFLDEVYSLPKNVQVGLLRAIQEKTVIPLGSHTPVPFDCRIIAAAKPDLLQIIQSGEFVKDLYFRLAQNVFTLLPLRERVSDIGPLVRYFCERWSKTAGIKKQVLANALPLLESYSWPGNINELETVIYNALDKSEATKIGVKELGIRFHEHKTIHGPLDPKQGGALALTRDNLVETLKVSNSLREVSRRFKVGLTTVTRRLTKERIDYKQYLGIAKEPPDEQDE
jgi:DNA-binding NtrC family response regulator